MGSAENASRDIDSGIGQLRVEFAMLDVEIDRLRAENNRLRDENVMLRNFSSTTGNRVQGWPTGALLMGADGPSGFCQYVNTGDETTAKWVVWHGVELSEKATPPQTKRATTESVP